MPGDLEPYFVPPPLPRRGRVWVHAVLLALTFFTTTIVGGCHHLSFSRGFDSLQVTDSAPAEPPPSRSFIRELGIAFREIGRALIGLVSDATFMAHGLWYSLTILAILGCHEMGHYLACVYYRVDATLPFFLPAPLPLTGTLGAFIKIRQRIPSKKALFDIAVAGPIAGFVIAVPALFIGLAMSTVERLPEHFEGALELGEPLLFRAAAWLIFGSVPDGWSINMHPMGFAAWFGLLATALNLFPVGQLDGGHIAHAVLGRRSTYITLTMVTVAIGLTFVSSSWVVWTVLMVLMLVAMGPFHPPTLDEHTPLDRTRLLLAVVALAILIVCFTPVPIEQIVTTP